MLHGLYLSQATRSSMHGFSRSFVDDYLTWVLRWRKAKHKRSSLKLWLTWNVRSWKVVYFYFDDRSLLSITLTHTSLPLLGASPPETPATSIRIAAAWSLRVPRFKLSPLSSLIHTHPRTSSSPTFSPGQALKTPSYQEFRTWASTDFGNPRGSWNQSPMRRAG